MIRVRQIKVSIKKDGIDEIKRKLSKKIRVKLVDIEDFVVTKKSIDARDKNDIYYVYEVNAKVKNEKIVLKRNKSKDISKNIEIKYSIPNSGKEKLINRPIIIGSGPCGLFATLILAEAGYKPLLIERGEKVEERIKSVENFWNGGKLNINSNVCFGEGGAGTFSDGKLNTMAKDSFGRIEKIFNTFADCGAPKEILFEHYPHIGTDQLIPTLINLRKKIIKLGGNILYNNTLTDIFIKNDKINSILINDEVELKTDVIVIAIGHSASDTLEMLYKKKVKMSFKKFAVGIRIQHPQIMINKNQYGNYYNDLPPANYKLTYKAQNTRGVYSFCMCPGGYVVNSSTEDSHLVINGMSYHARNSGIANSAIIVEVDPEDYGYYPLDGITYQRKLENLAFRKGQGKIPVQLLGDYINNKNSTSFLSIKPKIKGEYLFANINEIFPYYINDALKEAIPVFEKQIKGFSRGDAIISGVETRTSSAVRIIRDEYYESNIKGLYPAGEGAGYSGGIITSAIDGIRTAEKIIEKYSNENIE